MTCYVWHGYEDNILGEGKEVRSRGGEGGPYRQANQNPYTQDVRGKMQPHVKQLLKSYQRLGEAGVCPRTHPMQALPPPTPCPKC